MVQPIPMHEHPVPPIWPPPELGHLRALIEMQQTTIKFLIGEYNQVLAMVQGAGGTYGTVQNFLAADTIPVGWWQVVTGTGAQVTIGASAGPPPIPGTVVQLTGTFWSDGTATSNGPTSMVKVAMMQPHP